jgi:mRNA interferase RelE/StbE
LYYKLKYHPDVRNIDIPKLDNTIKERIKTAIETPLMIAPHEYGKPLRKTLSGYWKLRISMLKNEFKMNFPDRHRFCGESVNPFRWFSNFD